MANKPEIKNCPLCGSSATLDGFSLGDGSWGIDVVVCSNKACSISVYKTNGDDPIGSPKRDLVSEAIEHWNALPRGGKS